MQMRSSLVGFRESYKESRCIQRRSTLTERSNTRPNEKEIHVQKKKKYMSERKRNTRPKEKRNASPKEKSRRP